MQPTRDHQVQHKPKLILEPKYDAFAHPAQLDDSSGTKVPDWGHCCTQQEWTPNFHLFELLPKNTLLQRLNVNSDVRQFGHSRRLAHHTAAGENQDGPCQDITPLTRLGTGGLS
jgi:hypothetical protein